MLQAGVRLPISAIRRQIADAISLVVQVKRTHGGQRHVTELVRLVGCNDQSQYLTETLYPALPPTEIAAAPLTITSSDPAQR